MHVRDVAEEPSLKLRVVAGADHLDREISGAHVSELTEPRPWLHGGEFLMTIGLMLPMRRADCTRYLDNCREGAIAALALGVGPGLPYRDAPQPLMAAAESAGIPLLVVPADVPFIAVTKWVFAQLAEGERLELVRAIEVNRMLTAVATRSAPAGDLLGRWESASSTPVVVIDSSDQVVAATLAAGGDVIERARSAVAFEQGSDTADSTRWSSSGEFEIHRVGQDETLAHIVLGSDMDAASRYSSSVLVSLLSLDIERRHVADAPERARRAQVLNQLLRPGLKSERAQQIASTVGLDGPLLVAVVRVKYELASSIAFRLGSLLPDGVIRVRGADIDIVHPPSDRVLATAVSVAPGAAVGIGALVDIESLPVSSMQARSLVAMSERLGRPVDAKEGGTVQLLLGLGSSDLLHGFADTILAPLDALEPREKIELQRTLEEWIRANGAWDPAAQRLSVHRNTVRNRIERIAQLTGRRMDQAEDRMELWLALKARAAAPADAPTTDSAS